MRRRDTIKRLPKEVKNSNEDLLAFAKGCKKWINYSDYLLVFNYYKVNFQFFNVIINKRKIYKCFLVKKFFHIKKVEN